MQAGLPAPTGAAQLMVAIAPLRTGWARRRRERIHRRPGVTGGELRAYVMTQIRGARAASSVGLERGLQGPGHIVHRSARGWRPAVGAWSRCPR